ncbi:MAG: ATP-binding protein [Alphaproteobacteria bacterium]|nr:MAG: ATP-binding protein [Alphaproteobacteria bacterium]
MKSRTTSVLRWISVQLGRAATFLDKLTHPSSGGSKFIDLAPTDEADKEGVYAEALNFATNNERVFNIALTGPYGSGKSSIIKSFLKLYPRPVLNISLAAFVPGVDAASKGVHRQEIERSILQQMLYGADANRLPLSRFKRIRSPGFWSIFKTLFILIGVAATAYVLLNRQTIIDGAFFSPLAVSNWLHLGSIALVGLFLWMTIHHFYVASFGLSLKSISLKDIEIKPASDTGESILNRHLDEIIYFFQSTDYELVVVEDLDRFNDADIFVTLREINSLVNANAGVKRQIRFLYALRDDMFVNTDRTKFFEFIIPVIPIINASNSIDMVLDQGKRLALIERLDRQFLREVSRYLSDLRLITNIFNEYAIYVANLEADDQNLLDANKLLAVLIYKNVYPKDFEDLHRGQGNLAKILARHDEFVARGEAAHRSEIAALEQRTVVAERQTPADLRELNQIYAMARIEQLPENTTHLNVDGQPWIALQQLSEQDPFEPWISAGRFTYRTVQGYNQQVQLADIEDKVDPQRTYSQRRDEILEKSNAGKLENQRRIAELRSAIAKLRTMKFNELFRVSPESVDDLFGGTAENVELARFLVMEGYLDDTYYQYTSLFHSGRLSPSDNKFLIQIRAFITPDPDFQIDNAKEVVDAMRETDFGQGYVLNVKLVDCLLGDQGRYADQVAKLLGLISTEFDKCEAFLEAYYAHGKRTPALLTRLTTFWERFLPAALSSPRGVSHATRLVADLSEEALQAQAAADDLPAFVSEHLPEILAHVPELPPQRLQLLDFEVKSLPAIGEHPSMARAMVEAGLFELTAENIEYVYLQVLGGSDLDALRTRNYTTLRSIGSEMLEGRIEREFEVYLDEVLLELEGNSDEDVSSILAILRRDDVDQESLSAFVERQSALVPELSEVPEKLHAMLFKLRRISPTWENCLAFLSEGGFDDAQLISYLDNGGVRAALLEKPIPADPDSRPLRAFLFNAAALSDPAYSAYVAALPQPFNRFPEGLEHSKRTILINQGKITFSKEGFDDLANDVDLQVLFVTANIESYISEPDILALDDDFLESILEMEIADEQKAAVIGLMNLDAVVELPERAALFGPIMDRTNSGLSNLNADVAKSLIAHSAPVSTRISILNKVHDILTDNDVRQVLAGLPLPYSEIKTGYHTPRLDNNSENRTLLGWLDSRNIISSWKVYKGFFTEDLRVNLYRR